MMCDYADDRLLQKTALSIRALDKAERALEKARCLMPCDSYDKAVNSCLCCNKDGVLKVASVPQCYSLL